MWNNWLSIIFWWWKGNGGGGERDYFSWVSGLSVKTTSIKVRSLWTPHHSMSTVPETLVCPVAFLVAPSWSLSLVLPLSLDISLPEFLLVWPSVLCFTYFTYPFSSPTHTHDFKCPTAMTLSLISPAHTSIPNTRSYGILTIWHFLLDILISQNQYI